MATIYQHWTGSLTAREEHIHSETNSIDSWFPGPAPAGATKLAEDRFDTPAEVFHGVQHARIRVGPVSVTVGEDVLFQGTVEYFQGQG